MTASFELCEALYKASGWEADYGWLKFGDHLGAEERWTIDARDICDFPAYDASYLINKLKPHTHWFRFEDDLCTVGAEIDGKEYEATARELADALAWLHLELWRTGVFTREP